MSDSLNNIIKFGNILISKIKYDFDSKYNAYDFLKERFKEQQKVKKLISKTIYKK